MFDAKKLLDQFSIAGAGSGWLGARPRRPGYATRQGQSARQPVPSPPFCSALKSAGS